ncbi:hypothetical protein FHG87_020651 [Trinorchestia longiramus]|nr:hypothetical protein FHG87_020651 [Trinorchestia longiramus]
MYNSASNGGYQMVGGQIKDGHNRCFGGRFWCVRDICGIICAVMTWLLVAYADIVVILVICGSGGSLSSSSNANLHHPPPSTFSAYSVINFIIFNMLAFLALASHTRAMLSDPVSKFPFSFIITSVRQASSSLFSELLLIF